MRIRQLDNLAGLSWIVLCACFPVRAQDSSSSQDWQFTTADNPAQPTVATNSAGVATATIILGYASSGWLADLSGFGDQTGIWDLGLQNQNDLADDTRGKVLLSIPNPAAISGSIHTDLELRVIQFVDGSIYFGDLAFSIPGGIFSGRTVVEALPGALGGDWVEDQYNWRLDPSPATISLTITGAVGGTVLDRIRVDTAVPPLVITSVEKHDETLAIYWAGGLPPYQVYFASNLGSASVWQPIGQVTSGTNANIPLSGSSGLVKVGGSN